MRKSIGIIQIIVFLSVTPVICIPQDHTKLTDGFLNGRFWVGIPVEQRIGYLQGFIEGLSIIAAGSESCINAQNEVKSSHEGPLNNRELAMEIDSFFNEGSNRPLPIMIAIQYSVKKSKGATPKELEDLLTYYRKFYSEKVNE